MNVVLDPLDRESFPGKWDIELNADLLLFSSLPTQLDAEHVADVVANDPRKTILDVHAERDFKLQTMTEYCLSSVLSDGRGRSLPQIAGEICQLFARLREITRGEDTFMLDGADTMQPHKRGIWTPYGTAMTLPTINGLSPRKADFISLGYLGRYRKPSVHVQWLNQLEAMLESYALDGGRFVKLRRLEPPFELSTKHIVTEKLPPYYQWEVAGGGRETARHDLPTPGTSLPANAQ